MRLVRLPIPRVNVVKRPSLRPHVSLPKGKRSTTTVRVDVDDTRPVRKPAGRKSTVAEKLAYAMAASMLLGLGYLVCSTAPGVAPVAPDTAVTASIDGPEVTTSDIDSDAPETTTEVAPSTACDPYVPAKYRLCSTPIDSTRYPLKAKSSKRASKTSAPSVTTTTTVRKSTSATGAKSTTTTKSVKVTK